MTAKTQKTLAALALFIIAALFGGGAFLGILAASGK